MLPESTVRCPECFSFMNVKLQENGKECGTCHHCNSLINEKNRTLLVKPISSHDSEAILWNKGGEKQYARLECITLTKYLMELWELSDKIKYILSGRLVRTENKVGMIFELDHCEMYNTETGKRIWE